MWTHNIFLPPAEESTYIRSTQSFKNAKSNGFQSSNKLLGLSVAGLQTALGWDISCFHPSIENGFSTISTVVDTLLIPANAYWLVFAVWSGMHLTQLNLFLTECQLPTYTVIRRIHKSVYCVYVDAYLCATHYCGLSVLLFSNFRTPWSICFLTACTKSYKYRKIARRRTCRSQ